MLMRHPHAVNLLVIAVLSSTLTLFTGMLAVTGVSAQPATPAAATNALDERIRGWIEEAIDPDTGRGAIRLPAVGIDDTGDLTVVFALREKDDLDAFRAAAEEDVFSHPARRVHRTGQPGPHRDRGRNLFRDRHARRARAAGAAHGPLRGECRARLTGRTPPRRTSSPPRTSTVSIRPFGDDQGNPVAPGSSPDPRWLERIRSSAAPSILVIA